MSEPSSPPVDLQFTKSDKPVEYIQEIVGRASEETPSGTTHYTHYRIGRHTGDVIQIATRQQKLSNNCGPWNSAPKNSSTVTKSEK